MQVKRNNSENNILKYMGKNQNVQVTYIFISNIKGQWSQNKYNKDVY